ncbi:MAG: hypothetical protein OXU72_08705 [Gammaproteobacteria bacterium]|nr:hypothetical protein [Gammaproteobacteria bacterium]
MEWVAGFLWNQWRLLVWNTQAVVRDLDLFGIKPAQGRRVIVLCMAAIVVHSYWSLARYWRLRQNSSRILPVPCTEIEETVAAIDRKAQWNEEASVSLRVAGLLANWAAAGLTLVSWCILVVWMLNA